MLLRWPECHRILHDLLVVTGNVSTTASFFVIAMLLTMHSKQRTLEELDYIFGVPTRKFVAYNLRVALPWWWNRWVLFDKTAKLTPLYTFDGVEGHYQTGIESEPFRGSTEKPETVTKEL